MARYQRTETIILAIDIKTAAGVLTNPSVIPKITVTNPDGSAVVDNQNMVNVATGQYTYDYTPALAAVLGWHRVRYTVTDSGRVIIEDDGFELGS